MQDANAAAVSNALLPLTMEMQRRNDQDASSVPHQNFPAITPISPEFMNVDLDAGLNVTDKENLEDMEMELPSVVFKNKAIEETLERIKTENRSIGQKLGVGRVGQKVNDNEKKVYQSRKQTLETYKQIIEGLEGAKQFVSTPKKAGKRLKNSRSEGARGGADVIYYPNVKELCNKLAKLDAAKQAGNNGVDNHINSILDELLRVKAINKDHYNILYKNIFG